LALDKVLLSQPQTLECVSVLGMNKALIAVVVLLLVLAAGCKRKGGMSSSNNAGNSGSSAITPNPSEARALLEKGKLLYRDDQDSEAAESFKQAIILDPALAEAHFRLGLAYEALNKAQEADDEYKKAVEGYKKYFEYDQNDSDAEAHYDLGQTYAGLHQYSDAIREFRQAAKIRDDDPDIYYDLGMAHTRLAQYSEAAAAFSKSLEIDPENYRAQDALDEAREGVKRIQAGKKHQEDLLKKEKEEELKKAGEGLPTASPTKPPTPKGIKG
jgi:tetratricopeptide (TPR) repeat protein